MSVFAELLLASAIVASASALACDKLVHQKTSSALLHLWQGNQL